MNKKGNNNDKLYFIKPLVRDGRKGAFLQDEVIKKLEKKFSRTLLNWHLSEEKIDPRFAKQFVKQCFGVAGGMFDVQIRPGGVFLLQLRSEQDYFRVHDIGGTWMNGVYTLDKSWKEGKAIEKEKIRRLPIWVALPNFPIYLWCNEVFSAVETVLGTPVKVDAHMVAEQTNKQHVCWSSWKLMVIFQGRFHCSFQMRVEKIPRRSFKLCTIILRQV